MFLLVVSVVASFFFFLKANYSQLFKGDLSAWFFFVMTWFVCQAEVAETCGMLGHCMFDMWHVCEALCMGLKPEGDESIPVAAERTRGTTEYLTKTLFYSSQDCCDSRMFTAHTTLIGSG